VGSHCEYGSNDVLFICWPDVQREAFNGGMVYATKANNFSINRTADLTGLTREQVVRAMSNERRRLKAQGSTAAGLKVSNETAKLAKQLK
jgi:hypothetical protein